MLTVNYSSCSQPYLRGQIVHSYTFIFPDESHISSRELRSVIQQIKTEVDLEYAISKKKKADLELRGIQTKIQKLAKDLKRKSVKKSCSSQATAEQSDVDEREKLTLYVRQATNFPRIQRQLDKQILDCLNSYKPSIGQQSKYFIKKGLEILARQYVQDPSPAHNPIGATFFNVVLKGTSTPLVKLLSEKDRYDGLYSHSQVVFRRDIAYRLLDKFIYSQDSIWGLTTHEERRGFLRICRHRNNFLFYLDKLEFIYQELSDNPLKKEQGLKELVSELQQNINELDDPSSERVNTLEDGTRKFTIPGGWREHFLNYDFIKKGKDYFFVIYNRGELSSDRRFHSKIEVEFDNKKYSQTRCPILVSKKGLMNPDFLYHLFEAIHTEKNHTTVVYDLIEHFLIKLEKGTVVLSDEEILMLKLKEIADDYNELDDNKNLAKQYLKSLVCLHPNFHSQQLYSSCVESSSICAEKDLAPENVHRALKIFTIHELMVKFKREKFKCCGSIRNRKLNAKFRTDRVPFFVEALKKLKELKQKIKRNNSQLNLKDLVQTSRQFLSNVETQNQKADPLGLNAFLEATTLITRAKIAIDDIETNGFVPKIFSRQLAEISVDISIFLKVLKGKDKMVHDLVGPHKDKLVDLGNRLDALVALCLEVSPDDYDSIAKLKEEVMSLKKDVIKTKSKKQFSVKLLSKWCTHCSNVENLITKIKSKGLLIIQITTELNTIKGHLRKLKGHHKHRSEYNNLISEFGKLNYTLSRYNSSFQA